MEKDKISNWTNIEKTIGETGSENGTIVYDIEHLKGSRITIEKETDIAPFAVTLGVYKAMFHTNYFATESEAKEYVLESKNKIEILLNHLDVSENQKNENWKKVFNDLLDKIVE